MKTEKEDARDSKQQLCRANREKKLCSKSRFREMGGKCPKSLGLGLQTDFLLKEAMRLSFSTYSSLVSGVISSLPLEPLASTTLKTRIFSGLYFSSIKEGNEAIPNSWDLRASSTLTVVTNYTNENRGYHNSHK